MTSHIKPANSLLGRRVWALVLLVAMIVHTLYKLKAGILPELLWGCNVASFAIILGLWLDCPLMVGPAFLWHACLGDVAFAAGAIARHQELWAMLLTGWTSVVVHTLPTIAGLAYLRGAGMPRSAPYLALLLFVCLVPVSHYFTPAGLNINMAHVRWEPLRHLFPGNWSYRVAFCSSLLLLFLLGDYISGKTLGRPQQ